MTFAEAAAMRRGHSDVHEVMRPADRHEDGSGF